MHGRCDEHDLALGPDGGCVLCRRKLGVVAAPTPEPNAGSFWLLSTLGVLLAGGVLAAVAWRVITRPDALALPTPAPIAVAAPPPIAAPMAPEPPPRRDRRREREERRQEEAARREGSQRPRLVLHGPAPAEERSSPASEQLARAAAVTEPVPNSRDDYALRAARRRVPIALYGAPWCPSCRRAKAYLEANDIRFDDHDVDRDPRAQRRAHELNPRRSIPVIEIDGQVLVGFDPQRIEATIDAAARRRL